MATPMELSPLARLRPTERRRAIDRSNQSIKCKLPKLIENQSKSEALSKRSCGVLEKKGRNIMLHGDQDKPKMAKRSVGYALKRRNDRFVVEPIVGIVNPAYEPDLGGDSSSNSDINRKWQV